MVPMRPKVFLSELPEFLGVSAVKWTVHMAGMPIFFSN